MSKIFSKDFYRYDTIRLRTYIDIAKTGNLKLLVIKGYPTTKELETVWESILTRNSEANGTLAVSRYKAGIQAYGKLIADYELIKLSLLKLVLVVDDPTVNFLASKGYVIDLSSASSYASTINAALIRSNNLLTRIKMKFNELKAMVTEEGQQGEGIESALASMSFALGFNLSADILLVQFNEYKKVLKKRAELNKNKNARA